MSIFPRSLGSFNHKEFGEALRVVNASIFYYQSDLELAMALSVIRGFLDEDMSADDLCSRMLTDIENMGHSHAVQYHLGQIFTWYQNGICNCQQSILETLLKMTERASKWIRDGVV